MDKLCEKRTYEKNGKSIVRVYALQEIKIGTLILSETAQFKLENDDHLKMVCNENFVDHCTKSENGAGCKICFKKVFAAFVKMTPKNPPQVRERVGLLHSKYVPSTSCDARPECRAQNIFYGQFDDSSTRQIILHF